MKLQELNSLTAPTAEHLATARGDLKDLEQTVERSTAALSRAEAQAATVKSNESAIRKRIAEAKENLITERRRAYLRTEAGEAPDSLFDGANKSVALLANLDRTLDHQQLYPVADATTALLAARIAEATARAALGEGQAVYRRLSAILKFAAVAAEDPGVGAVFGETKGPEGGSVFGPDGDKPTAGSWSDRKLAEVDRMKTKDIPALREQLENHITLTDRGRGSLAAQLLWS
jgi:hypothetical protein